YVGVALKWRTGLCLAVVINTPIAVLAVQADMHTRIGVFLPAHTKARQPADFTIQSLADVTVLTTVVVLQRCRQAQVRWRCVRRRGDKKAHCGKKKAHTVRLFFRYPIKGSHG